MDTKICLSPRGTHLETYRVCEGMYYGCIVIAEEQPAHWFAEESPAFILNDWDTLPDLLDHLLNNSQRMQQLQQASLAYWDNVLAPRAVGNYIAGRLATLRQFGFATDSQSGYASAARPAVHNINRSYKSALDINISGSDEAA